MVVAFLEGVLKIVVAHFRSVSGSEIEVAAGDRFAPYHLLFAKNERKLGRLCCDWARLRVVTAIYTKPLHMYQTQRSTVFFFFFFLFR